MEHSEEREAERKRKRREYMREYAKRGAHGSCTVDGCERPMYGRSRLCEMHYVRRRQYGDVGEAAPRFMQGYTIEERLWARINKEGPIPDFRSDLGPCWQWTGCLVAGYGMLDEKGVHRRMYELLVGPVPKGLELDHLCRNRACCNPAHLEAVTRRENVLRGESFAARNAVKTHCKRGHPLDGPDAVLKPIKDQPHARQCRICVRLARNERYKRLGR